MVSLIFESLFSPPFKEASCDLKPRRAGRDSGLLWHRLYSEELRGTLPTDSSLGGGEGQGGWGGAERGI